MTLGKIAGTGGNSQLSQRHDIYQVTTIPYIVSMSLWHSIIRVFGISRCIIPLSDDCHNDTIFVIMTYQ